MPPSKQARKQASKHSKNRSHFTLQALHEQEGEHQDPTQSHKECAGGTRRPASNTLLELARSFTPHTSTHKASS